MKVEKMREWSGDELRTKEREFSHQLFQLRFQMASGQTDTLEKIRGLRKDIARVKTLLRQGPAERPIAPTKSEKKPARTQSEKKKPAPTIAKKAKK